MVRADPAILYVQSVQPETNPKYTITPNKESIKHVVFHDSEYPSLASGCLPETNVNNSKNLNCNEFHTSNISVSFKNIHNNTEVLKDETLDSEIVDIEKKIQGYLNHNSSPDKSYSHKESTQASSVRHTSSNNTNLSPVSTPKRNVQFSSENTNENTPLLSSSTASVSQYNTEPTSNSLEPNLPGSNNDPPSNNILKKLPFWIWILLGLPFLVGNIVIIITLFMNTSESQSISERLISHLDYSQIEADLKIFQSFDNNPYIESVGLFKHKRQSGHKKKHKMLAGVNYIKEQLDNLPQFITTLQTFKSPKWTISETPAMSVYIDTTVSLEYKKDFVVVPFSGNSHHQHHLHIRHIQPLSCSLYRYELKGKAVLLPYPSARSSDIGIPMTCPIWDLVYSAQMVGAKAVVFYLSEIEELPSFDKYQSIELLPPGWRPGGSTIMIPVTIVSHLVGRMLMTSYDFKVNLYTNASFELERSQNIVAKWYPKNYRKRSASPFIIGSHWDSDPITAPKQQGTYPITGAVSLLAIAKALDESKFIPVDRPIYLTWFGERLPLTLGVKAFIDVLWLNSSNSPIAHMYLDLGMMNENFPLVQNSDELPDFLRPISREAQNDMERIITFEYNLPRDEHSDIDIPTYNMSSIDGKPSHFFNQFGVPTAGLSSIHTSKNSNQQEYNVNQLTEVALATLAKMNSLDKD